MADSCIMYMYITFMMTSCFRDIFRLPSFVFHEAITPWIHLDPSQGQISNCARDSHDTIPLGTSQVAATWHQERRHVLQDEKELL